MHNLSFIFDSAILISWGKQTMHTNIGVRLKEIRKKNKLKQTQMAEIAHCSLRNYQNIESGKTQPGYGILYNIVHLLNA